MRHTRAKCTHSHHNRKGRVKRKLTYQLRKAVSSRLSLRGLTSSLQYSAAASTSCPCRPCQSCRCSCRSPCCWLSCTPSCADVVEEFSPCWCSRGRACGCASKKRGGRGALGSARRFSAHSLAIIAGLPKVRPHDRQHHEFASQSLIHSQHASQEEGRARCAGEHPAGTPGPRGQSSCMPPR
jgi:hypothetical protein